MLEVTTNSKYSNVEISNITKIKDFKFNLYENIVYINNTIHSDINNNLELRIDDSNTTFIIQNIFKPEYKKEIIEIKYDKEQEFISNNHFLKPNDIITLENITNNSQNLLQDNLVTPNILFKVIKTTRNSFILKTANNYNTLLNNIVDIIKAPTILNNSYFYIRSNKLIKQITRVEQNNKFFCINHGLKLNDIVKLENIKYNSINLLESDYQDDTFLYIVTTVETNMFELTHYIGDKISTNSNNILIINQDSLVTNGYFKLIESNNINSTININLPNNSTDNYGIYYNFIINDKITKLSINTKNDDVLIGSCNIGSNYLLGSEIVETSNNYKKFIVDNINLLYTKLEIINIKKNIWHINCNIFDNKISYKVTYNNGDIYLNNILLSTLNFYINFIYEFDISDSNLLNNEFSIVDDKYSSYFKDILNIGLIGTNNSKLIIYINKDSLLDSEYYIRYKNNSNDDFYLYKKLFIIKDKPIYFSN